MPIKKLTNAECLPVVEQKINEIFEYFHGLYPTKSGDIAPEQVMKLDGLQESLSQLVCDQVNQNLLITLKDFQEDKKVLISTKMMRDFFNAQYGMHWEHNVLKKVKFLHVYGGMYWIEELKNGKFYYEGAMGVGGDFETLEDAEKDLYNAYFK